MTRLHPKGLNISMNVEPGALSMRDEQPKAQSARQNGQLMGMGD
ncbi:hypothetical protein [Streptomyces carpinensis]|uniref:Uncharacterized protein n=1 Tax=Streptomyces carpinensis TaxID=66369 RepID=A0ABV1VXU0_9ACTN|nr:hypothetical protein [Streptomyces carpinensis]